MNKHIFLVAICAYAIQIAFALSPLPGGRIPQDLSNPEVQEKAVELAQFALDTRTDLDQPAYIFILSYSRQVVNGFNHYLSLRIFDNYNDFPYKINISIYQTIKGQLRLVSFVKLVPKKNPSLKKGTCPTPPKIGICLQGCNSDEDCSGNKKCVITLNSLIN